MKKLLFVWLDDNHTCAYCDLNGATPDGMALAVETIADAITFVKKTGEVTLERILTEIENLIFDDSRFVVRDKDKIKEYYFLSYWRENVNVLENGYVPFRIMDGFDEEEGWLKMRLNSTDGEKEPDVRLLPQWLHETLPWTECLGIRKKINQMKGRWYHDPSYPGHIIYAY